MCLSLCRGIWTLLKNCGLKEYSIQADGILALDEDSAKKVSEIMDQIVNLWGDNASWELDEGEHVHEANHLKLDCAKAKDLLGFSPKFQFQDSLAWTIEWYKAYHDREIMTCVQITLATN